MSLSCPSCRTPMISPAEFGSAVSCCRRCRGLWLNDVAMAGFAAGTLHHAVFDFATQIDEYIETQEHAGGEDEHVEEVQESDGPYRGTGSSTTRRCATCAERLTRVAAGRAGIPLETCASHGTFFDATELRTALNAIAIERAEKHAEAERDELIEGEVRRR